ncbi:MAG: LysM peptidoglycan-binding domain-containing protein, partial [Chitinophagaceae bacterium]
VYHDDDARDECFRRYARSEDSYMDHSDFLKSNQRYAFLFALDPTDYEGWAYGLRKAGYATNIRYSQILIALIKNYHLEDYSLIALGRMNESDHMVATASTPGISRNQPIAIIPDLKEELPEEAPVYPESDFLINGTRVIFAKANTAWLSLVEKYRISKSRLWDFNDLEVDDDALMSEQLVFLGRKRKIGATPFHTVKRGENLYVISQSEGIRYESLLQLNRLKGDQEPAQGVRLYLQATAPSRPLLASENRQAIISNPGQLKGYTPPAPTPAPQTFEQSAQPLFTMHTVAEKETLYGISKKYGVNVDQLVEWNKLDSLTVRIGQSLIVAKK